MNCGNNLRATSRWKKCTNSRIKSTKLDRSVKTVKQTPRPDKRHKPNKCQPLSKGIEYKR